MAILRPRTLFIKRFGLICWFLGGSILGQGTVRDQGNTVRIDLPDALARARQNSQQLQSASLDLSLAAEDRTQAKAALLPSLDYFNQSIYTQGNGTESGIFVSNDGVHVYASLAQVHQQIFSPERLAQYRRTIAAQALASAKRDIVERGLTITVIQNYYAVLGGTRRSLNAEHTVEEAKQFVEITQRLEKGGEVAHADVLKAQLVLEQSQRDLQEARLAVDKARIELAVIVFPDFRQDFDLVDDLTSAVPLPAYSAVEASASERSPELRAAQENVRQEEYGLAIARSAYLPSLSLDYFFGINANQFAVQDPEGRNRLGSSVQATLNIPVWDWWATRSKVRQADIRRQQAQLDLALAQKQFASRLRTLHLEAEASLAELDSLRRSTEAAAESLRLTSLRYQAGEVTVLEVVDAQSTLAQARNTYDDGLVRYRLAVASIQALTGGF